MKIIAGCSPKNWHLLWNKNERHWHYWEGSPIALLSNKYWDTFVYKYGALKRALKEWFILFYSVKLHSPSWYSAMVKPFIGWTLMGRTREGSWLGGEDLSCSTFISERREFTGLTDTPGSSTKHQWEEHTDGWLCNCSEVVTKLADGLQSPLWNILGFLVI